MLRIVPRLSACAFRACSLTARGSLAATPKSTLLAAIPTQTRHFRDDYPPRSRDAPRHIRAEASPSDSLFVGNIPWDAGSRELSELFEDVAKPVHAAEALDMNGRPRGFGTVRFASVEEAKQVLDMHSSRPFSLGGRTLNVYWSEGRKSNRSEPAPPSERVYYQNTFLDESELREEFGEHATRIVDWYTTPYKTGYITFTSVGAAQEAIDALNGKDIQGTPISLQFARPRNPDQQSRYDRRGPQQTRDRSEQRPNREYQDRRGSRNPREQWHGRGRQQGSGFGMSRDRDD